MDEKAQMLRLVAFHMANKPGASLDEQLESARKIYDYMVGAEYMASLPASDPAEPQPVMNPQ